MPYQFRQTPSRGCKYSIYVERFVSEHGTTGVLQWFKTMDEAQVAADEMKADGRFHGINSYVRSQETADAS